MRYNKKIFLVLLGIVLPLFLTAVDEPVVPVPVQNPGKQSVWNFSGARAETFTSSYFAQDMNATKATSLALLARRYINRYMSDLPDAEKQIMTTCFVTIGSLMLPDVRTCKKPEEQKKPDVQEALQKVYEEVFVIFNKGVIAPSVDAFEKCIDIFAKDVDSSAILATPDTFAQDIKVLSKKELLCYAPQSFIAHKESIDHPGFLGRVGGWFGGAYRGVKKALGATGRFVFSTIAPKVAVVDWMRTPFFAAAVEGMNQSVIVAPSNEDQMHIAQVYQGLLPVEAYLYLRIIADSIVGQQVITWREIMKAQGEGKPEGEVSDDVMKLVHISQHIEAILQKNADIFTPTDLKKCIETVQQAVMSEESITVEKLSEISDQTYAHYLLNPKTISALMYNQQKADRFVQTIQALWKALLPGEQTADQLRSLLAAYAPQALTSKQSEEQLEPESKDTGSIGVEGALPVKSEEGTLNAKVEEEQRQTAGSAVPSIGEKKDTGKMGEFNLGDTKDTYKPYFGAPAGSSSSATPSASGSSSGPSTSGSASGGNRSSAQPARTPSSGAGQPYYGSGRAPYKPSAGRPGYGGGSGGAYGTSFGGQQQAASPLAGTTASGTKDTKAACWHQSEVDDGSMCIDVYTGPFYPTHGEVVHQEQTCMYTKKAVGESKKLCLIEEEKTPKIISLQPKVIQVEQKKQGATLFTPAIIAGSIAGTAAVVALIIIAMVML